MALLEAADRAQHVSEIVRPALRRGEWVVSDRYVPSSLAYQGHGRSLDITELERLSDWASEQLQPDLVIVLDVPDEVATMRRSAGDRIEREPESFHEGVRRAYRSLAYERGWVLLDGSGDIEAVGDLVWAEVQKLIGP
jgi:dTMP kinase